MLYNTLKVDVMVLWSFIDCLLKNWIFAHNVKFGANSQLLCNFPTIVAETKLQIDQIDLNAERQSGKSPYGTFGRGSRKTQNRIQFGSKSPCATFHPALLVAGSSQPPYTIDAISPIESSSGTDQTNFPAAGNSPNQVLPLGVPLLCDVTGEWGC